MKGRRELGARWFKNKWGSRIKQKKRKNDEFKDRYEVCTEIENENEQ